jgi:hypothetical protein
LFLAASDEDKRALIAFLLSHVAPAFPPDGN